jgi:O-antigen ligase
MPEDPRLPSRLATGGLVTVAVVAPWPFGAVQPGPLFALTAACLLLVAASLLIGAGHGALERPALPLWPLVGFVALGLGQLVPLPGGLHALVAPGSSGVWHPPTAAAAAVLGGGPHPLSLDPDSTLRAAALVWGLGLLAWVAAPALSRSGPAIGAVSVVAAAGFCLSAYAIYARARFGDRLFGSIAVPTVRPFGPFVSKNHFAGYVEMASLLAFGLAIGLVASERARGRDWTASPRAGSVVTAMVGGVAMALAVLACLSRGGVISLAAGGLALLGLRLARSRRARTRGRLLATLGLAAGIGALLLALAPPEAQERMRSLGGASFRLDTWRDTVRMAGTSPVVGQGLGAFHDAYPRFKRGHGLIRVEHTENDYLETLAEGGLVGLGLALAGAGVLLLGGRGNESEPAVSGIGLGATAGLVALAVHSGVDFNLRIPSNAALAAVLAAAVAGAAGGRARPLSRAASAALGLGTLALFGWLAAVSSPPALEVREEARRAGEARTREAQALRLARAEDGLVRVLRRRPAHAESWLMLAGVRAAKGDGSAAAALARHAVSLDPERPNLREAANLIVDVVARGSP